MLIEERGPQDQIVVLQVYHVEVSVIVGSLVLEANIGAEVDLGTGALNSKLDRQRFCKRYALNSQLLRQGD